MDKQEVPSVLLFYNLGEVFFKALNNNMLRIKSVSAKGFLSSSLRLSLKVYPTHPVSLRLTDLDLRTEEEIILLRPLSVPIKSHVLEVEHLSIFFKCQDTETDQTAPFGVENRLHKSVVHASSL